MYDTHLIIVTPEQVFLISEPEMYSLRIEASSSKPWISKFHREQFILALLIFGGLIIRLTLMVLLETYRFPTEKDMGAEMGWIGQSLAEGEGFAMAGRPTAWMAPLYPHIVALVFQLFGSYSLTSGIILIVLQSITSSLVSLALYFLGKRLYNKNIGYLSALLWMILPGPILFSIKTIWSSSISALGMILIVLLFYRLASSSNNKINSIICGLTIGITALNDPVVLSLFPVGAIWLIWYQKENRKQSLIYASVIAVTAIIVILPWTIRNYLTFDQFVPIKDTFGMNFWQGNCCPDVVQPTAGLNAGDRLANFYTEKDLTQLYSLDEPERHQILMVRAVKFVLANPDIFVKYTIQRIYLFWRHTPLPRGTMFEKILTGIVLFTVIGIVTSCKDWRKVLLPVAIFIFYPLPYYLSISDTYRYRFPIEGLMYIFTAHTIYLIYRQTRRTAKP